MIKGLAKLKKVDIKEVWQHEAYDFSKWLVETENLGLLGEEIGLEIKPIQSEAPVGKFSVDILAEEEGSGRKIIIENQLQSTDHDHLGKIITYASGYDAEVIIWIVKECREEHQRAVDWLNTHTDEKIGFFLIKMELWQIDNSLPAPKFVIIVSPNEWAKTVKKGTDPLTETKLKQLDFWTAFKGFVEAREKSIKLMKPLPQHWYEVSIGLSDARISLNLNSKDNILRCQLYIPKNQELFKSLYEKKAEIEPQIGELQWDSPHGVQASNIRLHLKCNDIFNLKERGHYFEWFLKNTLLFKKVFSPYLKQFKANK